MATVTVLPTAREADDGLRNGARTAQEGYAPGQRGRTVAPVRPGRSQHRRGGPRACGRSFEPSLHGARLTARGKLVVGLLWAVLITAMVAMAGQSSGPPRPAETTTVVVQPGDTLWGLAAGAAPEADRRVTIDQITELNGLRSASDIRPGDVLVVPATGSEAADAPGGSSR